MAANISVLGLILYFSPYLRTALRGWPFVNRPFKLSTPFYTTEYSRISNPLQIMYFGAHTTLLGREILGSYWSGLGSKIGQSTKKMLSQAGLPVNALSVVYLWFVCKLKFFLASFGIVVCARLILKWHWFNSHLFNKKGLCAGAGSPMNALYMAGPSMICFSVVSLYLEDTKKVCLGLDSKLYFFIRDQIQSDLLNVTCITCSDGVKFSGLVWICCFKHKVFCC